MARSMPNPLSARPWLLPVGAFIAFVLLWLALVWLAIEHRPLELPMQRSLLPQQESSNPR
jgi:hypothetical protein